MIIIPAIDIRGGKCVRLTQGDFDQEKIYSEYPQEQALKWQEHGANFLHVVDLDGAKHGEPINIYAIKHILETVKIPIEVGGGIRKMSDIENLLDMGVERVILGSIAVEIPALVQEAVEEFGDDKILVGIDARDGIVSVHGWLDSGDVGVMELAVRMGDLGISTIVYTNISNDGTLKGCDADEFEKIAEVSGLSIIASGGVSSLEDIKALKEKEASGVSGVIIGKALYEGVINLSDAIKIAE